MPFTLGVEEDIDFVFARLDHESFMKLSLKSFPECHFNFYLKIGLSSCIIVLKHYALCCKSGQTETTNPQHKIFTLVRGLLFQLVNPGIHRKSGHKSVSVPSSQLHHVGLNHQHGHGSFLLLDGLHEPVLKLGTWLHPHYPEQRVEHHASVPWSSE